MKKTILTLFILFNTIDLAFGREFEAVIRNRFNYASINQVNLEDLVSDKSFDGLHFKIVKGKSEEAVSFDADKELVLKAATTYHHLTIARNYFINQIHSNFVASIPKMIIRIDHMNQFSELGHFANDNLSPQFNNALTIPGGKGLASRGVIPWGTEIWFRPSKKVHLSELNTNNLGSVQVKSVLREFRNQTHMQTFQRFLAQSVNIFINGTDPSRIFSVDQVVRTAGSSVLMEFGYQFIDPISQLTSRKWYMLETALVPEIIYHEYSHAALSDHLVLSHSSAIIEGMADFFAGQIAKSPKLAKHIKKYNTFNGKNAKKKQDYMIQFEMGEYANTDFVFGLLWELKSIIGQDKGEAFMYELRKSLTTNSSIRGELAEGILTTCEKVCESPFIDKLNILKALNFRGI
jgi:hypothetical protein